MFHNQSGPCKSWKASWQAPARALVIGVAVAAGGSLFGAACGSFLCLAEGVSWVWVAWWCVRGTVGGFVAGAIIGALSGVYHVEVSPPPAIPAPEPSAAVRPPLPVRTPERTYSNGVRARP